MSFLKVLIQTFCYSTFFLILNENGHEKELFWKSWMILREEDKEILYREIKRIRAKITDSSVQLVKG